MTQPDQLIEFLKEKDYSSNELMELMGVSREKLTLILKMARRRAMISSKWCGFGKGKTAIYTLQEVYPPMKSPKKQRPIIKPIEPKYHNIDMDMLPKKISDIDLIDWYNSTGKNTRIQTKELYQMAHRAGISVYRLTDNGIKYITQ